MSNHTANANCVQPRSTGAGLRAGMARKQLIYTIICAVAVLAAVISVLSSVTGGPKPIVARYSCLDHDHEFGSMTSDYPPIDCPKGQGQAAQLLFRKCRSCGEKVMFARIRMIAPLLKQREANWKRAEAAGQPHVPTDKGHSLGAGAPPMDVQYWIKQDDGSYAWGAWVSIASPQATQIRTNLTCSLCDGSLLR